MNVAATAPTSNSPGGSNQQTPVHPTAETPTPPANAMGGGAAFPDPATQHEAPAFNTENAPPPAPPFGGPAPEHFYWQYPGAYPGYAPCCREGRGGGHRGRWGRGWGHHFAGRHPPPPFGPLGYGPPPPGSEHPPSPHHGGPPPPPGPRDNDAGPPNGPHPPHPVHDGPGHPGPPPHEQGHHGPPHHGPGHHKPPHHGPGHHAPPNEPGHGGPPDHGAHHRPPHHGPGPHGPPHHGHGHHGPPHHRGGHRGRHHHGPGHHGPPHHRPPFGDWPGHHGPPFPPPHHWGPPPPPPHFLPPPFGVPHSPFPGAAFYAPDHDCPICNAEGGTAEAGGPADGMEQDESSGASDSSEASKESELYALHDILAGASLASLPLGAAPIHTPRPPFGAHFPMSAGAFPYPHQGGGLACCAPGEGTGPTSSSYASASSSGGEKNQGATSSESLKRMRQESPPRGMES